MSPIRVIVAGVADARCDATLAAAAAMAEHTGADLHVVHTFPLPAVFSMSPGMEFIDRPDVDAYTTAAREAFESAVRGQYPMHRLHVHAVAGAADHAILDLADRLQADLVVVGATRRGRISRALLGTTAQRVLRGSHAPVFVVRSAEPRAMRVLLTTDLSSTAVTVHELGLDVVEALYGDNPEVRTLLVVMEGLIPPPLPRFAVERMASAELSEFLAERTRRGHTPEPVLRFGLPAEEIVAEAERWGADLVVLGTHNRPAIPRLLLGSVAEAALRDIHCNVLVIPPGICNPPSLQELRDAAPAGAAG